MTNEQRALEIEQLLSDPANTIDVAWGHLKLGQDAEKRLDWDDAIEQYQRVIELAPDDEKVRYFGYNNRAYALLMLKRFEEAESHCLAAIDINNKRHNAHKNLGLACKGLGRPIDAATSLINAAFRNGTDERAWLHLQKLLTENPDLLAQKPVLVEQMEAIRKHYEALGGVPKLN
jgi:tetratricopeptide (TPR) repeat protein